jgi:hypothetical protein
MVKGALPAAKLYKKLFIALIYFEPPPLYGGGVRNEHRGCP